MPEPAATPSVTREPIHTRTITCNGLRRSDGLWDIEGTLVDTKAYAFDNRWRGPIEPGEPIHEMRIVLTFDDNLTIVAVSAETRNSPFQICPTAAAAYQALVGLSVGPGWRRAVRERLQAETSCTHLTELLGPMATTAFQTILPRLGRLDHPDPTRRPRMLNTCTAYAEGSENARNLWPEWHRRESKPAAP